MFWKLKFDLIYIIQRAWNAIIYAGKVSLLSLGHREQINWRPSVLRTSISCSVLAFLQPSNHLKPLKPEWKWFDRIFFHFSHKFVRFDPIFVHFEHIFVHIDRIIIRFILQRPKQLLLLNHFIISGSIWNRHK